MAIIIIIIIIITMRRRRRIVFYVFCIVAKKLSTQLSSPRWIDHIPDVIQSEFSKRIGQDRSNT